MYRYDGNGKILMSFSSDSTCFNNLHSPDRGFETLILLRQGTPLIPHIVSISEYLLLYIYLFIFYILLFFFRVLRLLLSLLVIRTDIHAIISHSPLLHS